MDGSVNFLLLLLLLTPPGSELFPVGRCRFRPTVLLLLLLPPVLGAIVLCVKPGAPFNYRVFVLCCVVFVRSYRTGGELEGDGHDLNCQNGSCHNITCEGR